MRQGNGGEQVMYLLVSEGVLPHTPSMYRHLSSHLDQARREGRFPDLIDPLREVHVPPAWPEVAAFLREAVDWFAPDRTEGQHPVYVAAEKDTLRQMFTTWLAALWSRWRRCPPPPPTTPARPGRRWRSPPSSTTPRDATTAPTAP
ncbi:hypothetical protein ABT142_18905 [Streptomyces sp. NPDC001857]|uniref:hypothetical protein n=1 Tax=unclassified Streptomyces TaxID=2593676 RepID=UPI003324829B